LQAARCPSFSVSASVPSTSKIIAFSFPISPALGFGWRVRRHPAVSASYAPGPGHHGPPRGLAPDVA
jgi:hypothetical protein